MDTGKLSDFLHRLVRPEEGLADSDGQLAARALSEQDGAAMAAIVRRHGTMVYRVCWRVLQHAQDAEDAFQATFLVLAQKLSRLRKHASLASWLHGVAQRVALKSRSRSALRRQRESLVPACVAGPSDELRWQDLHAVLDAELAQLRDSWRLPLILCYLESRTQDEAAAQLGWSKSKLRRQLDRARAALGRRLSRRGITAPAALSAVLLSDCLASAAPPARLVAATIDAAAGAAAGHTTAALSAEVLTLTKGAMKAMFVAKLKMWACALVLLGFLALGGGVLTRQLAVGQSGTLPAAAADASGALVPPAAALINKKGDNIQGTWEVVSIKRDEREDDLKERKIYLQFTADTMTARLGDKANELTYKLDSEARPKSIDILSGGQLRELGIYKLEGDTLTICQRDAFRKERPKQFENKDGSGTTSTVLKRVKPPEEKKQGSADAAGKPEGGAATGPAQKPDEKLAAAVKDAARQVKTKRAEIKIAEAKLDIARAKLGIAKAALQRAKAELPRWESQLKRLQKEVAAGVIDQSILLEAESKRLSAEADISEAAARLDVAEKEIRLEEVRLEILRDDLADALNGEQELRQQLPPKK